MSKRLRVPFLNWDQSALNSHSISYLNCIYGFAKSQITYMWNGGIILTHLILIEVQYLSWKLSASTCHYCCCVSCEIIQFSSVQFSCSVVSDSLRPHESQHTRPPCPSHLPEFTQIHVHRVSDAIQPSHPLSSPSPPAPNPSQHQSLFQWVNSSHEVAKLLEFQL